MRNFIELKLEARKLQNWCMLQTNSHSSHRGEDEKAQLMAQLEYRLVLRQHYFLKNSSRAQPLGSQLKIHMILFYS